MIDMAERRAVRTSRHDDDKADEHMRERAGGGDGVDTRRRSGRNREADLSAAEAGQIGLRQIAELTGKELEGVTGVEPAEDGWVVGVEVVEDRRIPSSTDILATYEIEIGMDGELVSYRRLRRYTRGRGDSSGGDSLR
jgi:Gas vesicle synthesis protein GvpO